jgi:hypothetical protein
MKRPRVSIAATMGGILFLAIAVAALSHPTLLWASLLYSLMLGILCLAAVGAAFGQGQRRRFWAGFAVFGWANYLLQFPLVSMGLPTLPATLLADYAFRTLHPPNDAGSWGSTEVGAFFPIAYSLSVIVVGFIGAFLSRAIFPDDTSTRAE